MQCCQKKPVINLNQNEVFCKQHFIDYFENRVFKTINRFSLIEKQENIGVALSGGKDSLSLLHILNKLRQKNPKIKVTALAIDEGIDSYRKRTLEAAKDFCDKNEINLKVFSFEEEFGMSLDNILKTLDVNPCTICGTFRRYLINKKSKELNLTKLATGHNLDDECQSILMNQFKNNIMASARLGPKSGIKDNESFVQRIKPLYLCSEKEIATYAYINNLLDNFIECPHVSQSYRANVRDFLNAFESKFPGTKNAIINSFLEILPELKGRYKNEIINYCKNCGEASSKDKCNTCVFLEKINSAKRVGI